MISRFLNLSNDFSQGVTVHSYLVPVTDFADASHSKSAKSAATTVSYGIFSSENDLMEIKSNCDRCSMA